MTLASPPDFTADELHIEPIERAQTIPASWYITPEFHALDREAIFSRDWVYVGHANQIPGSGDHLVAGVAGNPILVVRNAHGQINAFYNVCRHRAGPLATQNGCGAKMLMCQYHGWTYTFDGQLRGVPHWDRVDLFDKKDFGLTPVPLSIWDGLLFVNLDPQTGRTLASNIDGISTRIAPVTLGDKRFYKRVSYPVACNWKVYVDNYLEGYHVPIVHPELNKVLDYTQYVTELHPAYSLQYSPFKPDADNSMYGPDTREAFYYFIFPNLMLNIVGSRLQLNVVEPVDAGHCLVHFDYFYDDIDSAPALAQIAADIAYSESVQREDEEICARVQLGLQSRAYRTGRFSVQREEGVHHFQSLLKQHLRAALPAAG
jgi:choline monooxygenase